MLRDYKQRASPRKAKPVPIWKWLGVGVLVTIFIAFLNLLRETAPPPNQPGQPKAPTEEEKKVQEIKPEFQFYTILEEEQKIPDYEIKLRKREEQRSRGEPGRYILQAGSFREFKEADKRKAQLALLGVESQIEKTKIGGTLWNRIKIGPYPDMVSVDTVRTRLRENNIDVMVFQADSP